MTKSEEAVTALQELGLTEYGARCFVALTRISKGTAKEVSQVADVPRSRVYDTVERLHRRGLVDVQQSEPREYKAVSIETATRRIREDYDSRIDQAENALQQVDEPDERDEKGMWAISGPDHVADRVGDFVDDAEETIHLLVAAGDCLDRDLLALLERATDRSVRVFVEVATADIRDRLEEAVPEATVVVVDDLASTNPVYAEWPGKILMADQRAIVATGIEETELPDVTHEKAVWTYGRDHGFAAWTRELLDDRFTAFEDDRLA